MSKLSTIPKYKSLPTRLPPAKLTLFRSVVSHPPPTFAVLEQQNKNQQLDDDGDGASTSTSTTKVTSGSHQLFYSTAPRSLIPLTTSTFNHKLWNPPAANSKSNRSSIDKDESGRLAKFASKFQNIDSFEQQQTSTTSSSSSTRTIGKGKNEDDNGDDIFSVEGDLSFLEGATVQSSGKALGKKDVVGAVKSGKKGKK